MQRFRRPARWVGVSIVVLAIGFAGRSTISLLASMAGWTVRLPSVGLISVCGRDYRGGEIVRTEEEIVALSGFEPVVVDPGLFGSCPAANADGGRPCTRTADGPCATVVWVRVGSDRYVEFALSGGP